MHTRLGRFVQLCGDASNILDTRPLDSHQTRTQILSEESLLRLFLSESWLSINLVQSLQLNQLHQNYRPAITLSPT